MNFSLGEERIWAQSREDLNFPILFDLGAGLWGLRYSRGRHGGSEWLHSQISEDGGQTWRNITPPDMPKYTRVSIIDASRHDPATAWVAGNRYQVDDRAPRVSGIRGDRCPARLREEDAEVPSVGRREDRVEPHRKRDQLEGGDRASAVYRP